MNKKSKLLSGLLAVVLVAVAALNLGINSQNSELSDLSLANVEVLAQEITFGPMCANDQDGECRYPADQWQNEDIVIKGKFYYFN
ncbi:MAG: hypothetical protein LBM61_05075 [Prevotellaceae bacterium]|jgi:hypothetical protein|nr:hypothetical protein [Prevotellaceae bacterium]